MMKNLSLDSQSKILDVTEPAKKASVDPGANGNGQSQRLDRSLNPLITDFMDPTVAYFPNGYTSPAYYYGGYDGTNNDYKDYSRYVNPGGVDMSHGVYGDRSLMYPGYGYTPYGSYSPAGSPVPPAGQDGQLYRGQHYQYPSPYFPPMTQNTVLPKNDISKFAAVGQQPFSVDTSNRIPNTALAPVRPAAYQSPIFNSNGSYNRSQNVFQNPRYGFDGAHSLLPWLHSSLYSSGQPRNTTKTTPFSNANSFA